MPVVEIADAFKNYKVGKTNQERLATPYPKEQGHSAALVRSPYALKGWFLDSVNLPLQTAGINPHVTKVLRQAGMNARMADLTALLHHFCACAAFKEFKALMRREVVSNHCQPTCSKCYHG